MIDFGFDLPPKKHPINDLNIVPVLDMLVAIIFFLLLTTTFVGLTKLQVPPSRVSTITDPVLPPPLSPKLLLNSAGGNLVVSLRWEGASPGGKTERVPLASLEADRTALLTAALKLLTEFKLNFPKEQTIQLALQGDLAFQYLIDLMDASRDQLPDIVLLSPDDARGGG